MWYGALVRFLRRRLVLGIIFVSSLTYCVVSLLKESSTHKSANEEFSIERKPFVWRTLQEHNETKDGMRCRNSVQGKILIVDDRGYVCRRTDILKTGCCDIHVETTKRYHCRTCVRNNCCIVYEYCVSCCLDPQKRELLELVLNKLSVSENVLFKTVTDDYELCLAKCRTSSISVLHENSYKNPSSKHCFGSGTPGTPTPNQ